MYFSVEEEERYDDENRGKNDVESPSPAAMMARGLSSPISLSTEPDVWDRNIQLLCSISIHAYICQDERKYLPRMDIPRCSQVAHTRFGILLLVCFVFPR